VDKIEEKPGKKKEELEVESKGKKRVAPIRLKKANTKMSYGFTPINKGGINSFNRGFIGKDKAATGKTVISSMSKFDNKVNMRKILGYNAGKGDNATYKKVITIKKANQSPSKEGLTSIKSEQDSPSHVISPKQLVSGKLKSTNICSSGKSVNLTKAREENAQENNKLPSIEKLISKSSLDEQLEDK
jgi:hypothetical protein